MVDEGVGASGVSVGFAVIGAGVGWTVTDTVGIAGANVALIGDVGFVGLLTNFTQLFEVVCQTFDHTGLPYGSGQLLVCC